MASLNDLRKSRPSIKQRSKSYRLRSNNPSKFDAASRRSSTQTLDATGVIVRISKQNREAMISGLRTKLESVIAARDRDAKDVSSKWNDAREGRARRLNEERDNLTELIKVLTAPAGTISW